MSDDSGLGVRLFYTNFALTFPQLSLVKPIHSNPFPSKSSPLDDRNSTLFHWVRFENPCHSRQVTHSRQTRAAPSNWLQSRQLNSRWLVIEVTRLRFETSQFEFRFGCLRVRCRWRRWFLIGDVTAAGWSNLRCHSVTWTFHFPRRSPVLDMRPV